MKINKINIECETIYAVGDIHGCFNKLVEMIKRYDITNSCIIVCGDCGLGFLSINGTSTDLSKLNKLAKDNNVHIVMVRGNHDDPAYFNNGYINTDNIIAVPDYTVLNGSILLVGGATSIDRTYRQDKEEYRYRKYSMYHPDKTIYDYRAEYGSFYWYDEAPIYSEEAMDELIKEGIKIKHVCTHTCPSFCDPQEKDGIRSWIAHDPGLEEDINNERQVMDNIWNRLVTDTHPLESWTYGHYHRHSHEDYEGVSFTMLDAIINDYSNIDWIEIKDKNETVF